MSLNPVRDKLYRGEVSVGAWLNLGSPTAAAVMAEAGYEWLVVDAEHGQWDPQTIANTFRAIEARGAVPMARVWSHDATALGRLLDAGAMGHSAAAREHAGAGGGGGKGDALPAGGRALLGHR